MLSLADLPRNKPWIMGILNVTPDSFSDGGQYAQLAAALAQAEALLAAGANILDVGGESTRPYAQPLPAAEEAARVLPVITALSRAQLPAVLSIDTYKASVAQRALDAGARLVNDVSALRDAHMAEIIGAADADVVLMHMQNQPPTMQHAPSYTDVVEQVRAFLLERSAYAQAQGIASARIVIDPGLGFGKTAAHNWQLLQHISRLVQTPYPVLVGHSRKSFLAGPTARPPQERDAASAALCTYLLAQGVRGVRLHNVAAAQDALQVGWQLRCGDAAEQ